MPIDPRISLGARVPDYSGLIPGAINTYNAVQGIRQRNEARKADKFKQSQIERILSQPRTGDIGENIQIGESLLQYNQELGQAQIALGQKSKCSRGNSRSSIPKACLFLIPRNFPNMMILKERRIL